MKKLVLILFLLIPLNVFALNTPDVYSSSVLVYDATIDEMVISKNIDEVKDVASLTKVLTVITALNNIDNLDEEITITQEMIASVPYGTSNAGLQVGDKVNYMDLLYGAILPSGADATHALAFGISGNIKDFAVLMNEEARKAGATHSNFVNPSGMTENGHKSTAEDQLMILKYALKNEIFQKVYSSPYYKMSNGLEISSQLNKYRALVTNKEVDVIGLKTGFTKPAGYCLSLYFQYLGHDFYLITLGALPSQGHGYLNMTDASTLMNEIVNEYLSYNLIKKDKVISSIKVKDSTIDSYDIKINKDYNYYFPSDFDKTLISYEFDGIGEISSDNNVNDFIGVVNIYYNTKLIDSINIYLNKKIYKSKTEEVLKNTWSALLKLISLLGVIIIIILAIIVIIMLKFKSVKVQSINEDQLRYILKQIETNKGMMHGYSKGKKVYFKIIKLDTKQMKVTLKKLK